MPILVRKAHDLVFDGRTIARAARLNLPGVHWRPVQVSADQVVDGFVGVRNVAIELVLGDLLRRKAEWPRIEVAGLHLGLVEVDGPTIHPAWGAGLEAC